MSKKSKQPTASAAERSFEFHNGLRREEFKTFDDEAKKLGLNTQELEKVRDKLRAEQRRHFAALHKKGKVQEKELRQKELEDEGQIEKAVRHIVELEQIQKEELVEMDKKMTSVKTRLGEMEREEETWQRYENVGSVEDQQKIQSLQGELDSMQKNNQAMAENIECVQRASICKTEKSDSELMEREELLVFERALKQADKNSVQKILKNDRLKKQFAIYHEEVSILDADGRNLKKENMELTKQLYEHQLGDVRLSHDTSLTPEEEPGDAQDMPLHPLPCDPGDLDMVTDRGTIQKHDRVLTTKMICSSLQQLMKKQLDMEDMSSAFLQNVFQLQASPTRSKEPQEMAQLEACLDSE